MPFGGSRQRRRPGAPKLLVLVVLALVLVTGVHAATTSMADVTSSVRADSNVNDDTSEELEASSSSEATSTDSSSTNPELRALTFHDALTNTWDLLTTRTLRPKTSTADEADGESTSADSEGVAVTVIAAPIKAESLSLSADDAVTAALKTATPTVTPSPVATPATATPGAVPTATPLVTPAPVVTPVPSPVQIQTPTPTPTPSSTPSPTASDVAASESKGSLDTEELVKNSSIKSGSANSSFDETIVVMIIGGLAVIGVVVLVMSRKISKETGDDEAIRRASSFGISRL